MAAADYFNVLQKFYLAYFGRPADPSGLQSAAQSLDRAGAPVTTQALLNAYSSNATVRTLIDNFGNSAESQSLYAGSNTTAQVTAIYGYVLNRAPDTGGLNYWVGEINSGRLSLARASLAILAAAENDIGGDAVTINNRLVVATSFTNALDTPAEINAYVGNAAASVARNLVGMVSATTNTAQFQSNINNTIADLVSPPAPAVIGNPSVASVTEDTNVSAGSLLAQGVIAITDPNPNQNSFQSAVTGTAGNLGTLVLSANGNYTYSVANSAVQFLGTNQTKVDTFTVASLDGTTKQVSFTINGANDAPTLSGVPVAAQAVTAGMATALADFTVADIDSTNLTVTLSATNGVINGLTDTDTSTAGIQLTGAPAAINAAIAAATFTATAAGPASIAISVSDALAPTVTGTYALSASAAPPPPTPAVIGDPSVSSVTEDVAVASGNLLASGNIPITDVNNGEASFSTTVTPAVGNLGALVLSANGNYTYSVANSAVQFLGTNQTRVDTFTVASLDGTTKQVSFTINGADEVVAANQAPVNTVPGAQTAGFATPLTLTGLSVADTDAGAGMLSVTLAVTNGKLTVPTVTGGATITTNGSTSVTLTGTVAAINASLAGNPVYTPDYGFAGAATLTVTTSDNGNTGSGGALTDMDVVGITVNAPVALQTFTPNTGTNFGSSDASTALPVDNRFILVGDDEANVLRVYERSGGPAVAELAYGTFLGIGNNELDLEGSTQIGNTLYFIGSHGNSRAGADANNREHIFSATVNGTGAATTVSFTGQFNGLEAALVSWDQTNAHGLGANRFGFAASAVAGSPERNEGLGIEGLTSSADGSALWVGFRAPVTGGPALNLALIVPITNIGAVLAGTAQPVFGNAIQLDLGGRGIRSIEHNASGQYIIVAGPTGNASADVADDFRLYTWDGSSSGGLATNLQQRAVALDGLLVGGGSFETIVQVPVTVNDQAYVQLLQDDGGVLVGGTELKDLPPAQQYFNGNFVQLGAMVTDIAAPLLVRSSPADGATGVPSSAQLVLTFNEPVRAGTGNLVLTPASGPVITLAANAPGVVYEYNTITITSAAAMLQPGTVYALTAAPGVVLDAAGNPFGGLAAGALDFTTAAAPAPVNLLITEVNSNATGGDFFELFNFGSTAIDLTGFRWDDNSLDPAMGAVFAAGTTIAAGGRLVVGVDTATVANLRSNWNIPLERDVVAIGGPGVGTGDAVALFNASGALVAAVNFGSTSVTANGNTVPVVTRADGQPVAGTVHAGPAVGGTAGANGVSLVWDGVSTSNPAYQAASVGTNNGYAQSGAAANIGSPGLLPADRAPAINSNGAGDTASINYAENGSAAVTTVSATDANLGDVVGFSITGGADAARFSINPTTGVLTFLTNPDFEAPTDVGLNNVYDVVVSARDRIGLTDTQAIAVTVTDVAEGPAATLISAIQGEGAASSLVGQTVTVQARVTAWVPGQNLFYLMEETADRDGNVLTSEGIAVAYTGTSPVDASSIGDIVRLSGVVAESFGQTQITYTASSLSVVFDGTAANLEAARVVTLPIAIDSTLERHEGEYITVQSTSGNALFVADTFTFARFGETTLYADAVPFQFTEVNAPSVSGNTAYLDFLARNSIQIDDGSSASNPSLTALNSGTRILRDTTNDGMVNGTALGDGGVVGGPVNFIRVGDTTSSVTGVLGFSFGAYDLTPTQNVNLTANPRPPATPAPDVGVGAEVKVASFNVLNYFTTLGTATFTNPSGVVHEGRGATNTTEFTQQQAKIVAAMLANGAHVFGLNELQNNGDAGALASLVNALNAAAGSNRFAAIGGHATGTDAIRVGIVYDQTVVQPLGLAATPNTTTYSAFAAQNRLPVAQTFGYLNDDSKQFTVVVNHLKSKGGTGTGADADLGDGAGQFNATRLAAVQQLNDWLNTNPTSATDGDYLLVGDLNSYRREAPVTFLEGAGYTLAANPGDYSYLFDGLRGSLDHILTRGLGSEITGFAHFNINADEQVALDYNDEFGDGSVNINLDRNDLYRSSDHDPVVIGLRLNSEAGSPVAPPADVLAPTLMSNTPADDATNVAVGANIVLNFNEAVKAGIGNITLNGIDPATPDLVIAITDTTQVSISGSSITINPTGNLAAGSAYAVRIDAGAVEDLAGNDFAGLLNDTALNFSTAAALAGQAYFSLAGGNFMENWTDTTRISANDNWSGVPFIVGYLGDIDGGSPTGVDPQTVLGPNLGAVDVIANQTNTTITNGGVAEFEITNPVVALQGSGTADAPSLVLYVNATGRQNITVAYNLRDIDGSADNAIQAVALQYRIGDSGNFTNVSGGFVADASSGPSLATQVTAVSALLPAEVNGQSQLQIRIVTTNAAGNDEFIGIDDIVVSSQSVNQAPTLNGVPTMAQAVTAGTAAPLDDFTVADIDSANLTVTLTPTNGVLNGLTDADAAPGIQLSGSAMSINAAIAAATFTATAAGTASIGISVSDALAEPVTATYSFTAAPAASATPTAGSIAFLGFNADGNDGYAFVVVDALAVGQVIYFRDDEWNGTAFADANEGITAFTNNTGTAIAAGTLIEVVNLSTGTLAVNIGTIANLSSGRQAFGNSDETLYAYTSTGTQTTGTFTFLAAFASGGYSAANGLITGTGLTTGSTAVEFTNDFDVFAYNAGTAPTVFTGRSNALSNFNNAANWVFQDGTGNQDADNITPDAPFLTDPQSPLAGVSFVGIAGTTEMM